MQCLLVAYLKSLALAVPKAGTAQNENAPDSSSRGTSVEQPSPRTAQEQCSNQPRRSEWHARASGRQTQANSAREVSKSASGRDTDKHLIEQIELDLLKSERNTDPTVMETALAEDYVELDAHRRRTGKDRTPVKIFENTQAKRRPTRYARKI